MDVVERIGEPGGELFKVDAGLLRLGVELLDVPLSHESVLAARAVLTEHSARPPASCRGCCVTRWRTRTRTTGGPCPHGCIRWWCRHCSPRSSGR